MKTKKPANKPIRSTQHADAAKPSPETVRKVTQQILRLYVIGTAAVSGGCLMILEIAASRILAPIYGNTVFLWSAVIGVIMAALSVGYWLGGVVAERRPSASTLGAVLLGSSVAVALVAPLSAVLSDAMVGQPATLSGPVLASLLLFLFPGILMGMVSPLAVKLVAVLGQDVGRSAGTVYSLSTVGSILGTFLAGFVLIPSFGVKGIVLGISLVLGLCGLLGFVLFGRAERRMEVTLFLAVLLIWPYAALSEAAPGRYEVHREESFYHRISIQEGYYLGHPSRLLFLDTTLEGAMFLDEPGFPMRYTEYVRLVDLFLPQVNRAAFVGGGGFGMPKWLMDTRDEVQVTVFELDPKVVEMGHRYFLLDDYPGLQAITGDARQNLSASPERFDLIFGDAYNGVHWVPFHLTTKEYYEEVKKHLSDNGLYMTNLISPWKGDNAGFFQAMVTTVRAVFPEVLVFTLEQNPTDSQNVILVAFKNKRGLDYERLSALAKPLDLGPLVRHYKDPSRWEDALTKGTLLTDDYAPVERLLAGW